ncbi:MAG: XRE family transcriptional regulator [Gammaproteobacteria bacterium]|nr:MAG: XRE family transcriptional regulator [Gammaproteobacteria bacterium]
MKKLSFDQKYDNIKKDSNYDGVFITAVITTGIFCRPTCRARKPHKKNVLFYDDPQTAIKYGFRPCKICHPMQIIGQTPEYIKNIIKELNQNPYLKIKDYDLRQRDISPATIRRWFQKYHNITFHAYQRMLKINMAYNQIKGGNSITDTAFGLGYDSLSGFNYAWQSIFGKPASKQNNKKIINIIRFNTKLGAMFACASQDGLCLLDFTDRRMLETEFKDLCKRLNAVILPGDNKYLDVAQIQLEEYMTGKRDKFDIPLDMVGTDFQKQVWQVLLKIPYGKTWSYKQQAQILQNPKAVRAVANANGCNKIGIIIPCHRIIGSDGSLTGYGGGLYRKQWLLDLENAI